MNFKLAKPALVIPSPLANLEKELAQEVEQSYASPDEYAPKRTRSVESALEMQKVQELLQTSVTAAHEDTCKAIDKAVGEAKAMMDRLVASAEKQKAELHDKGQRIALELEASLQILTRAVEWVEKQLPELRNPRLVSGTDLGPPESEK